MGVKLCKVDINCKKYGNPPTICLSGKSLDNVPMNNMFEVLKECGLNKIYIRALEKSIKRP